MRVAFTGTSSTGKTSLATRVMSDPRTGGRLSFITADARALLRELSCDNIDNLSVEQRRAFQFAYLERKLAREEAQQNYLTDRSFVDLAAYWLEYTKRSLSDNDEFVSRCQAEVGRYDVHFYFPPGLVPFELDGYRSIDAASHLRVDANIRELIQAWNLVVVRLDHGAMDVRIEAVVGSLLGGV